MVYDEPIMTDYSPRTQAQATPNDTVHHGSGYQNFYSHRRKQNTEQLVHSLSTLLGTPARQLSAKQGTVAVGSRGCLVTLLALK